MFDPSGERAHSCAHDPSPAPSKDVGRRELLRGVGQAAIVAGIAGSGMLRTRPAAAMPDLQYLRRRPILARELRINAAQSLFAPASTVQPTNGDEALYADLRSVYGKALPHNALGEPDPVAFQALTGALRTRRPEHFESIPLAPGAVRKLANPQGSLAFELSGSDGHTTRIAPAPTFAGPRMAAEMLEVYWQALTRDVPFQSYDSDPAIGAAVTELNTLPERLGPASPGALTPSSVFRGTLPGDEVGPYISQFLYLPVPYGLSTIVQTYRAPVAGSAFMTDYATWLAIQRGANPSAPATFDPTPRYIFNGRYLAEYVHVDFVYQAFLNAALILLGLGGGVLDRANPYLTSASQGGFVTFGGPDILDLVAKAGRLALTGAWFQKWQAHRSLRPEVLAARVENQMNGSKNYGLSTVLTGSNAVSRIRAAQGNSLLPLAFPEGSPTHPSYPAGHAAISGACTTVLKAFFRENAPLSSPVQANLDGTALVPWTAGTLTVGGELNKLASNISIGRDVGGVHWRSDADWGLIAGEQQAIALLQDYSRIYNEQFDGFTLTRFDGTRLRIRSGQVTGA